MAANPEQGLRCAGTWLLVMGILGGVISPFGSLWAFIAGCMFVAECRRHRAAQADPLCALCLHHGHCLLHDLAHRRNCRWRLPHERAERFCGLYTNSVDYYCGSGRRLDATSKTNFLSATGVTGRALQSCTDDDVCIQNKPGWSSTDLCSTSTFWCTDSTWQQDMMDCCCASCGYDTQCNPGCPDSWRADGYCDDNCNVASCNNDDGDCDGSGSGTGGGRRRQRGRQRGGSGSSYCEMARAALDELRVARHRWPRPHSVAAPTTSSASLPSPSC